MPKYVLIIFFLCSLGLQAKQKCIDVYIKNDTLIINSLRFINCAGVFYGKTAKLSGLNDLENAIGSKYSRVIKNGSFKLFLFDSQGILITTNKNGAILGIDLFFNLGKREIKELPKCNFSGNLYLFGIKIDQYFNDSIITKLQPFLRVTGYFTQIDHPFLLQIDHPKQTTI